MALTTFADISALVNNIQEGALFTLRSLGLLPSTVLGFYNESGMNPRVGYDWGSITVNAVGENDDLVGQNFSKSSRVTLTPARYGSQVILTDQRIRTDWESVRDAVVMELGMAHAADVDTKIASNFSSLTGGTIGTAGSTLTWTNVIAAKATLRQGNVPGPFFCVLGEGQWYHLLNDVTVDASAFSNSDARVSEFVDNYYVTRLLSDVVFVISDNLSGAAGTAAYGAMYNRLALAFDERDPFGIEPERNASRKAWELNSNHEYAHGVWAATYGAQMLGTDVIA